MRKKVTTMISTCQECQGSGSYKVYNAYNPEVEDVFVCEYCDGFGVTLTAAPVEDKKTEGEWLN